jgi:protein phosphatase
MPVAPNNASNTNRHVSRQSHDPAIAHAPPFEWTSASLSNVGLVRRLNEDACLDQSERGLWAVADGMGGHARGDLASRMVIDALQNIASSDSLPELIASARFQLLATNSQLRTEAARLNVRIIGSTVVALIASHRTCAYVWAGDSRIYLCRDGTLTQITRDHSQIEMLRAAGNLTADMLANHPARNLITRAVGAHDSLQIDEDTLDVNDGDMFLLCSDGLSNEVTDQEICDALATGDCRLAAKTLMDIALMRGGHDNISVVIACAHDGAHAPYPTDETVVNPLI